MQFKCKHCGLDSSASYQLPLTEKVTAYCQHCGGPNELLPENFQGSVQQPAAAGGGQQSVQQPSSQPVKYGPTTAKRASMGMMLGFLLGGLGVILVGVILGMAAEEEAILILTILVGAGLTITGSVFSFIYLYRAWEYIQDENSRATPGQAVGFLFIPFFNYYWMFQAYWGWAEDYNSFVQRNDLPLEQQSPGLFLAMPITSIASIVPLLGILSAIASLVLWFIVMAKMINAVNSFADLVEQGEL